jgi:hypothetical protein
MPQLKYISGSNWVNWKQITMEEFAEHVQGTKVVNGVTGGPNTWEGHSAAGIALDDGSAVVAISKWSGPYSEVTPDVDAEEPEYWLSKTKKEDSNA